MCDGFVMVCAGEMILVVSSHKHARHHQVFAVDACCRLSRLPSTWICRCTERWIEGCVLMSMGGCASGVEGVDEWMAR